MREKILKILNNCEFKINDKSVFFWPDIPEKKVKNAINSYATSAKEEDVFVLVDDTVFGKADEGLLITEDFLYVREAFNGKSKIPINQIRNVTFVGGVLATGALYINGNKITSVTQPSKRAMNLIAEVLSEIGGASVAPQEADAPQLTIQDALINLKSIFEMGLISKDEYEEKRKEYIARL